MSSRTPMPILPIPEPRSRKSFYDRVGIYSSNSDEVAGPLMAAGVIDTAIFRRKGYRRRDSGPMLAPIHRIRLQLGGRALLRLEGTDYTVYPGDLVIIPQGSDYHYAGSKSGWCWLVSISVSETPRWELLRSRGGVIRRYESADYMYLLVRRILNAYLTRERRASEHARQDCYALVDLLERESIGHCAPQVDKRLLAFRDMVDQIRMSPGMNWSIDRMMAQTHQSRSSLIRMCKREHGLSPMQLVIKHRLTKAVALLKQTDYPLEKIARIVGYKSPYTFSNLLAKHLGRRPTDIRPSRNAGRDH